MNRDMELTASPLRMSRNCIFTLVLGQNLKHGQFAEGFYMIWLRICIDIQIWYDMIAKTGGSFPPWTCDDMTCSHARGIAGWCLECFFEPGSMGVSRGTTMPKGSLRPRFPNMALSQDSQAVPQDRTKCCRRTCPTSYHPENWFHIDIQA